MQAVCDQKLFGMSVVKAGNFPHAVSKRNIMNPAELLLEWQVFLSGLAVSGILVFAISVFSLM